MGRTLPIPPKPMVSRGGASTEAALAADVPAIEVEAIPEGHLATMA
jgi:hypothetical protein